MCCPYKLGQFTEKTPVAEPEETVNNPVAYPSDEVLENGVSFAFLPEDISRYMESLFMQVRNS